MSSYVFPGYPPFLEVAATELGRPESAAPAGRIAVLTALANLCSQASRADPAQVADILAKAAEFRDQLETAIHAADLMLADVQAACSPPVIPAEFPDPPTVPAGPPEPPAAAQRSTRAGAHKTARGSL